MNSTKKLGALTDDDLRRNKPDYYNLDYKKAKFTRGDEMYPAVRGIFKGIGMKEFEWEGNTIQKFTLYLSNGQKLMQIDLGMWTWTTFQLMNLLKGCNGSLVQDEAIVTVAIAKGDNDKPSLFLQVNDKYIKYKFKYADLKFPDDKSKRDQHLKKIIKQWYDGLLKEYEYNPETSTATDDFDELDDDKDIPF